MAVQDDMIRRAKLMQLAKLGHPLGQTVLRHAPVLKAPTPEALNQRKPLPVMPAYAQGGVIPSIPTAAVPSVKMPTSAALAPVAGKEGAMHAAPLSTPKGLKESLTKKTKPKV